MRPPLRNRRPSVFTQITRIWDPGSMVQTHRGDSRVSPDALPRTPGKTTRNLVAVTDSSRATISQAPLPHESVVRVVTGIQGVSPIPRDQFSTSDVEISNLLRGGERMYPCTIRLGRIATTTRWLAFLVRCDLSVGLQLLHESHFRSGVAAAVSFKSGTY